MVFVAVSLLVWIEGLGTASHFAWLVVRFAPMLGDRLRPIDPDHRRRKSLRPYWCCPSSTPSAIVHPRDLSQISQSDCLVCQPSFTLTQKSRPTLTECTRFHMTPSQPDASLLYASLLPLRCRCGMTLKAARTGYLSKGKRRRSSQHQHPANKTSPLLPNFIHATSVPIIRGIPTSCTLVTSFIVPPQAMI